MKVIFCKHDHCFKAQTAYRKYVTMGTAAWI